MFISQIIRNINKKVNTNFNEDKNTDYELIAEKYQTN